MTTAKLTTRPYQASDFDACLALFDSNVPRFFSPEERTDFAEFLRDPTCPYQVVMSGGAIVGCGGIMIDAPRRKAGLAWGMVDHTRHNQGIGRALTLARIEAAIASGQVDRIELSTSQHTAGFYERLGFGTVRIIPDGFGPDLHRYDMVKTMGPAQQKGPTG